MTLLQKYHKQRISKKSYQELESLKRKYALKYPDNLKYTLKLILTYNSIKQKETFEKEFERFRNNHLDMWDNLSFTERNKLFQLDFEKTREQLNSFYFEDERIYIPIFDILFNNLYDRETPILELPQYFKLQHEFKSEMIDVGKYGLLPYKAGLCYPCLAYRAESVILFDKSINTFYRLNDQVVFYPLLDKVEIKQELAQTLANHLNDYNDAAFFECALENGLLHSKLVKKVEKKRR